MRRFNLFRAPPGVHQAELSAYWLRASRAVVPVALHVPGSLEHHGVWKDVKLALPWRDQVIKLRSEAPGGHFVVKAAGRTILCIPGELDDFKARLARPLPRPPMVDLYGNEVRRFWNLRARQKFVLLDTGVVARKLGCMRAERVRRRGCADSWDPDPDAKLWIAPWRWVAVHDSMTDPQPGFLL